MRPPPPTAIFGGTFDPVHNTHLDVARAAADAFHLNRILFVPAGSPPLKAGALAAYEDRVAMLGLALHAAGDPRFEVSRIEDPATHPGSRSYSIHTVESLMNSGLPRLSFIVGADAFADIQKWYRWRDLVRAVDFIVVSRPGATAAVPPGATVHELPSLWSPVSSSAVRAALDANSPGVPVPASVLAYIREHSLYRSRAS
jgi:nicotinate-nucleotide adenylyltransferase